MRFCRPFCGRLFLRGVLRRVFSGIFFISAFWEIFFCTVISAGSSVDRRISSSYELEFFESFFKKWRL